MVILDKTDLKLLSELDDDARQTVSKIAKTLNTSQQVISFRINSLKRKEIISEYYSIINFTKLGYTSYRTMIRFSNINKQKHQEIIKYLTDHPNVLWLVDCGGRWDLLVNFLAKDIKQYSIMFNSFKSRFPQQIRNYDVLTTIDFVYPGRAYLFGRKPDKPNRPYVGIEREKVTLDNTDLNILKMISEDARLSSVIIGNHLGISSNTVMTRIKEMGKKGVLLGAKPLIHLENTPYRGYKALIKFQDITEEKEKSIISFLMEFENIVGIIRMVGMWDFELEIESEKQEDVVDMMRSLRDRFHDVIKEFEMFPLFHEYKYNFFPRDLLEEHSGENITK